MCLEQICTKPERKWGTGYKVYIKLGNKYISFYRGFSSFELGKWYKDPTPDQYIIPNKGKPYEKGFHVFRSLKVAMLIHRLLHYPQVLVKVRYRKVVATGQEQAFRFPDHNAKPYIIDVAKEIYLIEEVLC